MKHPKDWKDGECPECGKPTEKINSNWAKCYNPECMFGKINYDSREPKVESKSCDNCSRQGNNAFCTANCDQYTLEAWQAIEQPIESKSCKNCGEKDNLHYNYDYDNKCSVNILCNECGYITPIDSKEVEK